jgi:hypothetical protein
MRVLSIMLFGEKDVAYKRISHPSNIKLDSV